MRRLTELKLKEYNITFPQFGLLLTTYTNPDIIQKEAASLLETDNTTIMVISDSLETKGLIKRMQNNKDRRSKKLLLTAEGKLLIEHVKPQIESLYKSILDKIDRAQIVDSIDVFKLVLSNIKISHDNLS
jgi:MarR family transcriptional regulator for hemolysin